jgi:uncharacterized protein YfaS (alpha-2-macroglobulin family)
MLYVYKQFDRPSNATGVPVIIDVIDANGNSRNIGTTTSDANGVYSLNWTPDIPGKYTVYVTFAGSKAYWGSFAQSAFVIDAAPDVTTAPVIEQTQSAADLYFVPAIIGLFIAIVAVGLMTVLVLRKRPQIP